MVSGDRYTYPPVLTSSGGHRSGRYASYWNAFLFISSVTNDVNCFWTHEKGRRSIEISEISEVTFTQCDVQTTTFVSVMFGICRRRSWFHSVDFMYLWPSHKLQSMFDQRTLRQYFNKKLPVRNEIFHLVFGKCFKFIPGRLQIRKHGCMLIRCILNI